MATAMPAPGAPPTTEQRLDELERITDQIRQLFAAVSEPT